MFDVASPAGSHESSAHNPGPRVLEETPTITTEHAANSATPNTMTSLPTTDSLSMTASQPIVTIASGNGATTSHALATASTGLLLELVYYGFL
jgi:hypothetical protein